MSVQMNEQTEHLNNKKLNMYGKITNFIKDLYPHQEFVPLHEPCFSGNEKKYLNDCIDSTYVSSVGQYVDRFEEH